jgi:hypothetical protein
MTYHARSRRASRAWLPALLLSACAGCSRPAPQPAGDGRTTPVYNKTNGRLEQLVSDRDGDGTPDTRAFMDGTRIARVEIDRDNDGRTDRWEYYLPAPASAPKGGPPSLIERADEAAGPDQKITRREFFVLGVLQRTEEDTDRDGRMDKWEHYDGSVLTHVEFDLSGCGHAERRLVYGADGNVVRIEVDPDGDGKFEPAPPVNPKKGGGL